MTIILLFVFFLAAFTQGVTGFGSALIAVPLLSLAFDLKTIVPLSILNGLVITLFLSIKLKRHLEWKKLFPLMIGCMPGVYAGLMFLKYFPVRSLKVVLGILLVGYGLFRICGKKCSGSLNEKWGYLAGLGTGLLGASLSTGGPPTVIYTTLAGWSKDEITATLSGFFLFTGILVALSHLAGGMLTESIFHLFLISLPAVIAGVIAGGFCYTRLDQQTYLSTVHVLLIIMGLAILRTALW